MPLLEEPGPTHPNRKRWTRKDCEFLERVGLLSGRYELLDGEIIEKVGQNLPHALAVSRLIFWLMGIFGPERVLTQTTVQLAPSDRSNNRPEPDAIVLHIPGSRLVANVPAGNDILLVAEVSDVTLRDDLQKKALLYARARVAEYVILDVISRRIIVHQQPNARGYALVYALTQEDTLTLLAAPNVPVQVTDLLSPTTITTE